MEPEDSQPAQAHAPDGPMDTAAVSRALVGDMLLEPVSPLTWSMLWESAFIPGAEGFFARRLGIDPTQLGLGPLFKVGNERITLNAELLVAIGRLVPRIGGRLMARAATGDPAASYDERPPTAEQTPVRAAQWLQWVFGAQAQTGLEHDERRSVAIAANRPGLDGLSDIELVDYGRSFQPVLQEFFHQHWNQMMASVVGVAVVEELAARVGLASRIPRLIGGLGKVETTRPSAALWELSRQVADSLELAHCFEAPTSVVREQLLTNTSKPFRQMAAGLDRFIGEFGPFGPNDWDLFSACWESVPDVAVALVDCLRRSPSDPEPESRFRTVRRDRNHAVDEVLGRLEGDDRHHFDRALSAASTFVRGRELSRSNTIRVINEVRQALLELARRGVRRGDFAQTASIWMLTEAEVTYYADGGLGDVRGLTDRRLEDFKGRTQRPAVVRSGPDESAKSASPSTLVGLPAGSGTAVGTVKIVADGSDLRSIQPGQVLVFPVAQLISAPVAMMAKGAIVGAGGPLSHLAVVLRELGIPTVMGVSGVARHLKDGDIVQVDGLTGEIRWGV